MLTESEIRTQIDSYQQQMAKTGTEIIRNNCVRSIQILNDQLQILLDMEKITRTIEQLSETDKKNIKRYWQIGETYQYIADLFAVEKSTIIKVLNEK